MSNEENELTPMQEFAKMATVINIDPGNKVVCDCCNEDYTDSKVSGGILFGTKAVCPKCAPTLEADAKKYAEEHFIRGRCDSRSFADWVREDLR